MTLRERIRYITDALEPETWLTLGEIVARVQGSTYASIQTVITKMVRADELQRRGSQPRCEYRSGPNAALAKTLGRPKRSRMGFMALARLEVADPVAYEKAVAADRGRV